MNCVKNSSSKDNLTLVDAMTEGVKVSKKLLQALKFDVAPGQVMKGSVEKNVG